MDSPPVVHDREEELIDPRDFLPPSFFVDSVYLNNSTNSFVEPPSESRKPSTAIPSPLTRPEKANPVNKPHSLSHSLTPHQHHLPITTPTPSASCDDSSIPHQPALSQNDRRSSPVAIANFPDRPRQQESNRRLISDKVSSMPRFTRTTPPSSPDQVSAASPESVMHYPPNATRLMRVVTNTQFRALGAKRALKRKE